MRVGVPTEVKNGERRVAMTPAGVHELVAAGHQVVIQAGAGEGSAISDDAYVAVGAGVLPTAAEVWQGADLICKVKEPVPAEYGFLREGLVLFTYLHAAADRGLTDALLNSGVTGFAYETVCAPDGSLPLLAPMSEVAGRLAVQIGAHYLMSSVGGAGRLLGGVPGVPPARVTVIGGGVSGQHAAEIALGMRAEVTVLDRSVARLRQLDSLFGGRVRTLASSAYEIGEQVAASDVVIGAVLVPGARAPQLVTDAMVARMRPGSVLVDISVDQGGCFESTHPTTHAEPVYTVQEATFCCVANLPGAVPVTSTHALTNATLPYVTALAGHGWREAMADPALAGGLTTDAGRLFHPGVAQAHDLPLAPPLPSVII